METGAAIKTNSKAKEISKLQKTEAIDEIDGSRKGKLGQEFCKLEGKPPVKLKRQSRVGERPKLNLKKDSLERMQQETKLVVLEYLSSLPSEKISARNGKEHGGASVVKAKTIHTSERPFLDVIVKRKKGSVTRRNSEEYDAKVREKLIKMAKPLRKKLTPEILQDIKTFDKDKLKQGQSTVKRRDIPYLQLAVAEKTETLDSPITAVALHLDQVSQDIMTDYPQLLDEHLTELLTPLESEKKLTYEEFSVVARSVFEKQLARFTSSVWTKLALVFYLVKEVLYSGVLTDFQMELVVDYAARFITETSADKIRKQGGWVGMDPNNGLLEEDLFRGDIYNPLGVDSNWRDAIDGSVSSDEGGTENVVVPGYFDMAKETARTLSTYTAAALAVGIGFAYAYFKQQ